MATKLKNMKITSVDLVEAGANQKADINFFKGRGEEMATENEQMMKSIQCLNEKLDALLKSTSESEVSENSEITPENSGIIPEEPEVIEEIPEETPEMEVEKSADISDVKKLIDVQLSDIRKENEQIRKENAQLKKTIELSKYEQIAKKYEVIGENPKELAQTLYDYQQAGGDFYQNYISILDKAYDIQNNSDVFKEFGSSRSNDENSRVDSVIKSYTENGLSEYEAYAKAAIEHPELMAEYDELYRG